MSHNDGDSFVGPIPISAPKALVRAHGEASPTLALGSTQIYVVWEQEDSQGAELLSARSVTWGHSFEKPVKITDKSKPSFNGFSSVAVAPDGDVYVVWLDGRDPQPPVPGSVNPEGTFSVYLARSTDQGATFGKNIRVAFGACPCCRPSLAFGAHGEVFVAWRKVFPDDIRDMVVATSHDHGITFGATVRVATDNWKIRGCPDSGPALAAQGNRLYVAWLTEGAEGKAKIKLAWSNDGANTFKPALSLSGNVLDANHPALASSEDGRLLLVFQGRDPSKARGWGPIQPYLVEIQGEGRVSEPKPIPSNQQSVSYPALGIGTSGRVFIAWTENTEHGSTVALCRGRSGTS